MLGIETTVFFYTSGAVQELTFFPKHTIGTDGSLPCKRNNPSRGGTKTNIVKDCHRGNRSHRKVTATCTPRTKQISKVVDLCTCWTCVFSTKNCREHTNANILRSPASISKTKVKTYDLSFQTENSRLKT